MTHTVITVLGMTCGGCEKAVSAAALGVKGVSAALANRAENALAITWQESLSALDKDQALASLREAIKEAGFECPDTPLKRGA